MHQRDGFREYRRLVGQRDACIDVEHVRPGLHLGDGIPLDPTVVAFRHLRREHLAPGGIDALADDDERALEADDDLLGL